MMYLNVVFKLNRFNMLRGVLLVLDIWYKKIVKIRNELSTMFAQFDVLIENVRPLNDIPPAKRRLMHEFIRRVYDCHLSEFRKVSFFFLFLI